MYLRPWETLPHSAPSDPNAESRRELAATRERMLHLRLSREVAQLEAIDVLVQSEVLKFDSTRWYELPG